MQYSLSTSFVANDANLLLVPSLITFKEIPSGFSRDTDARNVSALDKKKKKKRKKIVEVGLVGGWTLNSSVSGRLARHGFDTFFAIVEKANARNDDLYAKVEWEIIGYGFVRNSKDFSSLKRIPFLFFF